MEATLGMNIHELTKEQLIAREVDISNVLAISVGEERKLSKELKSLQEEFKSLQQGYDTLCKQEIKYQDENEQLKKQHEELKQKIGAEFTELMDDYLENYLDDKGFGGKDLDTILKEHDTMTEEQFTITHGVQLETGKTIKELIALSKDK